MSYNPLDQVNQQKNLVKSNIERMYAKPSSDNMGSIQKSAEPDLVKGGEGSHGGKVIGHTKSGKAIYDKFNHASHSEFNKEDHDDAVKAHTKGEYLNSQKHIESTDRNESRKYNKLSESHFENGADHALLAGENNRKKYWSEEVNNSADNKNLDSEKQKHIEFATKKSAEPDLVKGGEGSHGGKVIGHTKSGKAIYQDHNNESHKEFSKDDHEEAKNIHRSAWAKLYRNSNGNKREANIMDRHIAAQDWHYNEANK